MHFDDIQGIRIIFAEHTAWPNPANLFIIPDEKGFSMIDVGCGGAPRPKYLIEGLEYWDLHIQDLHTVLLSHAHPDHMGAMGWILQKVRPRVFIHHLDVDSALNPEKLAETFDIPLAKRCLNASENAEKSQNFELLNFFKDFGCAMSAALNVEGIGEGHVFHLGDFAFEVIHTPGHSPGHISLMERNRRILLPGDLVGKSPAWYTPCSGGVTGYLDSLAKLEVLDATIILPAHGTKMSVPLEAIQNIRERLLKREIIIRDALIEGPKTFMELNQALFENPLLRFFPGCGITESHLIKLEREKAIRRKGGRINLVPN